MNRMLPTSSGAGAATIAVVALSVLALAIAMLLAGRPDMPFEIYFGPLPPVVATLIVVAAAAVAQWVLQTGGVFLVVRREALRRGLALAGIAGALFAVPTIVADMAFRFPEDINAPLPGALLFYPLMGYVAETVFHLLPLAALVLLVRIVLRYLSHGAVSAIVGVVALVEPAVQASGAFHASTPVALDVFMLAHLTLFSWVLLTIYRRYGFLTAFAFRLAYYLVWHIVWGWARLSILF